MPDDLASQVRAAIRRSDASDRKAAKDKAARNELIRQAVRAGAITVTELYNTTSMSKSQVERVLRGESSGNRKAHAATPSGDSSS